MTRITPEQFERICQAAQVRYQTSPKIIAADMGIHVASVRRIMRWHLLGESARNKRLRG